MKRRTVPFVLGCLLVIVLVLASCGPTTPTTPPATKPPTTILPTTTPPVTTPAKAVPKYGGTLSIAWVMDPLDFDQAYRTAWQSYTLDVTNETLYGGDITKGPAGTGEMQLKSLVNYLPGQWQGLLMEKWETPDPTTWILHIRKGVRFHNKPPVNGREMTADDVALSIKRMFEIRTSWLAVVPNRPTSITAQDKYTVVIKFPAYDSSMEFRIFDTIFIVPRELVVDKDGKETEAFRDWKNACGTGPWMMSDFVKGSSVTFVKNPDYWQYDPFHPQNKLPYIDTIKVKIIPELTTRVTALRTGAIDLYWELPWEQAKGLASSNPELRKVEHVSRTSYEIHLRNDTQPFSDIRVRQALSMAVDRNVMIKDLFGGFGEYLERFYHPYEPWAFVPYDKLPADIKDTYTYNPEKAKKLLADAGYPNGFETTITVAAGVGEDPVVFVANSWGKIGVRTKVDVKESPVYTTILYSLKYPGAIFSSYNNNPANNQADVLLSSHYSNFSVVRDPWWDETYAKQLNAFDPSERNKLLQTMNNYALEKVYFISLATPHMFTFWHPWVKQWEGALLAGCYHYFRPLSYAWLDKGK